MEKNTLFSFCKSDKDALKLTIRHYFIEEEEEEEKASVYLWHWFECNIDVK